MFVCVSVCTGCTYVCLYLSIFALGAYSNFILSETEQFNENSPVFPTILTEASFWLVQSSQRTHFVQENIEVLEKHLASV